MALGGGMADSVVVALIHHLAYDFCKCTHDEEIKYPLTSDNNFRCFVFELYHCPHHHQGGRSVGRVNCCRLSPAQ
jgi:hypothetical protein